MSPVPGGPLSPAARAPPIDLARALTVDALLAEARRLGPAEPGVDLVRPGSLARSPWALERIRSDVLAGRWRPQAVKQRGVWKRGGGTRTLSILAAGDRVLQGALHRIAAPALDTLLDDRVHGWRKGRGCPSALRHLAAQAGTGPQLVVVQADIASLFDTLPHAGVDRAVAPLGDDAWAALHRAWLRAWPTSSGRGVPQGAPLSPLLANLALAGTFDRVLDLARVRGLGARLGPLRGRPARGGGWPSGRHRGPGCTRSGGRGVRAAHPPGQDARVRRGRHVARPGAAAPRRQWRARWPAGGGGAPPEAAPERPPHAAPALSCRRASPRRRRLLVDTPAMGPHAVRGSLTSWTRAHRLWPGPRGMDAAARARATDGHRGRTG